MKQIRQKKVLVIHADTENSLAVIRSLGSKQIPIVASATRKLAKASWSRYVKKRIKEPNIIDPENNVKWLIQNAKNKVFDILLPTGDDYVWIAANYYDILSKYMKIPIASKESINTVLFKEQTYRTCEKYNTPHPKTYYIKSYDEVVDIADNITYPVIIKSRISFGLNRRIKGTIVYNKKELLAKYVISEPDTYFSKYANIGLPLIQEYIPGGMTNLYTVAVFMNKSSDPTAIFCGRKIRQYPPNAGSCCFAECSYDEQAVKTSISFLRNIKWNGPAEVEIKKDERTGEFKIIEVNPRTYSWVWLAIQCEIDLPLLWYNSANGEINRSLQLSSGDLAYSYDLRDKIWLYNQLKQTPNKYICIKNYYRSLNRKKTHGVWNYNDPLPELVDYTAFLTDAAKCVLNKIFNI